MGFVPDVYVYVAQGCLHDESVTDEHAADEMRAPAMGGRAFTPETAPETAPEMAPMRAGRDTAPETAPMRAGRDTALPSLPFAACAPTYLRSTLGTALRSQSYSARHTRAEGDSARYDAERVGAESLAARYGAVARAEELDLVDEEIEMVEIPSADEAVNESEFWLVEGLMEWQGGSISALEVTEIAIEIARQVRRARLAALQLRAREGAQYDALKGAAAASEVEEAKLPNMDDDDCPEAQGRLRALVCETDLLYPPKSVVLSVMDPPPQPPSSSTSSSSSSSSTASKVDEVLVGVVQLGQIECPLYGRRTPILHVQGAELPNMDADLPEDMDAVPAEGGEARQGRGAS